MIALALAPFGYGQHRRKGPFNFSKPGISFFIGHKLLFYNYATIVIQQNIIKIRLSSVL
jgi:hypothetical protein